MIRKSLGTCFFMLFLFSNIPGQTPPDSLGHFVPPPYIRAADVMWQKRIWRVIDTRQRINENLYYPIQKNATRISLFDLIKKILAGGEIAAYYFNPIDMDAYSPKLTRKELMNQLSSLDTIANEDNVMQPVVNNVTSDKIRGYLIKEDWIFDKQRSVLDARILWICPRIVTINKNTQQEDLTVGPTNLFWVSFIQISPILAQTPVFNQENDAETRSFYDIFVKRQFASYIIQESNVFNRSIAAYMRGVDALYESDRIQDKIRNIENNMWQY